MRASPWPCLAAFSLALGAARGQEPTVTATSPPSLRVRVSAGEWTPPGAGKPVAVPAGELEFDPPELRDFSAESGRTENGRQVPAAPPDYQSSWASWDPWPEQAVVRLTPRYQDGTLILGGLFRAFREDTLRVASTDVDGKVYERGVDYVYDADWGLVANKEHHIAGPVTASAKGALQRLDLIQVSLADGKLLVKKGQSAMVAPELPAPDAGCAALAGVYLAPWRAARNPFFDADPAAVRGATDYAITEKEIAVIRPQPPVAPVRPEAVARTLRKLRAAGVSLPATESSDPHPGEVRIAFMGDSITLGAESTLWYRVNPYGPDDRTYRGTFVRTLRERFPRVVITPIEAYKGGAGIELAVEGIDRLLTDSRPDLVIIAFGANDVNSSVGGEPHTPVDKFRAQLETLIDKVNGTGAEALLVTSFPLSPFLKNGSARRQPAYNDALRQAAYAKRAAVADVYTEYSHLGSHGVPPWSTLHNWINHPDDRGHQVYADVLLSFFPAE